VALQDPLADTFGGTYDASRTAGSSRTLTFTGSDAALASPQFSTACEATIYCDGTLMGTIDLYTA
jgi:hypothetical protein